MTWLLEHGADPNKADDRRPRPRPFRCFVAHSTTPLDWAAEFSDVEMIDLLIHYGARLDQSNALHVAANAEEDEEDFDEDRIPMMRHLLGLGVDIDAVMYEDRERPRDVTNWALGTALHYAAVRALPRRVEFLLQCGANRERPTTHRNDTPLDWINRNTRWHCKPEMEETRILLRS